MKKCLALTGILALAACGQASAPAGLATATLRVPDSLFAGLPRGLEPRLDAAGREFLGRPYLAAPLGEGDSALGDPQPRLRLDGFDCVTYIETVEALSRADSVAEVPAWMDRVRYREGRPVWAERNHFTEAEWIPRAVAQGRIRLVAFPGDSVMERRLARAAFYGRRGVVRADTAVAMRVLPTAKAEALFAGPGIRDRVLGVGLVGHLAGYGILHTGFVVERKGAPALLRHASQAGTVREQPLSEYLAGKRSRFDGLVLWEYLPLSRPASFPGDR